MAWRQVRGLRPEEIRAARIKALYDFIVKECKGKASIPDIYRFAYQNWGYTLRRITVDEYINVLLWSGDFIVNAGQIVYRGRGKSEEGKEEKKPE